MAKRNYENYNAGVVLSVVERYIEELDEYNATKSRWQSRKTLEIDKVYDELSIFDWWNPRLSVSQLKDMKRFLNEAIKLGYTGYVCFKVGASGCANGMWAYKVQTENGFSPKGEFLYKSFTPDYNCWNQHDEKGISLTQKINIEFDGLRTIGQLETALNAVKEKEV